MAKPVKHQQPQSQLRGVCKYRDEKWHEIVNILRHPCDVKMIYRCSAGQSCLISRINFLLILPVIVDNHNKSLRNFIQIEAPKIAVSNRETISSGYKVRYANPFFPRTNC